MTNAQTIFEHQILLLQEGKLHTTGRIIKCTDITTGEEKEIEEPQSIHTYQAWKSLGYQVKKGEKAIAQFPIWKYVNNKKAKEDSDEEKGHMFLKTASFFSAEQVERIEK